MRRITKVAIAIILIIFAFGIIGSLSPRKEEGQTPESIPTPTPSPEFTLTPRTPKPTPTLTPAPVPTPTPMCAEFEVSSLKVYPSETFVGGNVTVSVDVKNVGNAAGIYECTLAIDGVDVETKEVTLSSGEVKTVTYTIVKGTEGNYTVQIDELTAVFTVYPKVFRGAYWEYEVKGIALLITVEGMMRTEVIEIAEENYITSQTTRGIPGMKPQTTTFRFDEPMGLKTKENMLYVGEETISTIIGTRKVLHYYYYNATEETKTDYYIDKITNVVLLVIVEGESLSLEVRLSDTNIKWLKG